MSIRIDRPSLKRKDENDPIIFCENNALSDSEISISSEEEGGSGTDSDQRFRTRPIQDIWETDTIRQQLLFLDDYDKIYELINNEDLEALLLNNDANKTGLLLASWLGRSSIVKFLIDNGADVDTSDTNGRTPLHLATYAGKYECVKILLDAGAQVNAWDLTHSVTPIHCAASRGHLSCLKILIQKGAEVNAGITNRSPLHYAVQSLAADCVRELLEAGAIPNTPQVFTEAPLHVAATLGSSEIVRLLIKHGAAVTVQCGPEKTTALHLAAEDGNVESVRLLLNAGAQVMAVNKRMQTPLHLATTSQSTETLELLLKRGADPNATDIDGRTPLHSAIAKASRCECVRLLLVAGANVNKPDAFGYTSLHLAALNEFSQFVLLLINYGGDVTARTKGGISVLTFITRRTPDVIPKYIAKFDSAIKLNDHELGDVDCELKLDFRALVPATGKGETELLLNFIDVGHREILKHPLCETFLFLKWKRIRKFFLFSLFYHSLFVLLYTGYTVGVFLRNCPQVRDLTDMCSAPIYARVMGFTLIWLNILVMCKELFQIAHNWAGYLRQWENWLQWLIIMSVFLSVIPSNNSDIRSIIKTWQHHVAAVGIFLSWLELMIIVGRFPIFGLYVQMFTTVSLNFSKFLLAYSCLIIAFGLSFGVLFVNYKSFQNLSWGLLKTVIMMSGELEFEDMFYDPEYEILFPITTHVMFLAFVLLVTLILSNLLVGLAVSDIQGLLQSAGLDRLVRQAELVAHLESMLFSRLLRCAPRRFLKFFYNHALLLKSQYHWALYVRPNDPREERIPKELIKNIYCLVAEQKDKIRAKNRKSHRKRCSQKQTISPPVSRLNSNMSTNTNSVFTQTDNASKNQIDLLLLLRKDIQELHETFAEKFECLNNQR